MEIDPHLQLQMLLTAFLSGVSLGLVCELFTVCRILLGAYTPPPYMRQRYEKTLPFLHRAVPFARGDVGQKWSAAAQILPDLLLCLLAAVGVILTLYRFNHGAMRLSVPVMLGLGLWLCRTLARHTLSVAVAYLAYGLAAAALYLWALLLLPWRLLRRLYRRFVWPQVEKRKAKRRAAVSAALCRAQLALAANGLQQMKDVKTKGRTRYVKKKSKRQDDSVHQQ